VEECTSLDRGLEKVLQSDVVVDMAIDANLTEAGKQTHLFHDKVRQSVTEQSKSKKHRPITGSDFGRNGLTRAYDWCMLFLRLFCSVTLWRTLSYILIFFMKVKPSPEISNSTASVIRMRLFNSSILSENIVG